MTPQTIIQVCAKHFGCHPIEVLGRSRIRNIAAARQVSFALIYSWIGLSKSSTANVFGMTHRMVNYSMDTAANLAETDPIFASKIKAIILDLTK